MPRSPEGFADAFARGLGERFGLGPGDRVVVGVSGGVDSTVLLHALHGAGLAVVAAHVNYALRGEASDADEAFVRALADDLGVPFHVRRVRKQWKGNVQEVAREARYRWFPTVAQAAGAATVAVGSTLDDQAETVLMALFRGTSLHGLVGMPAERPLGAGVRLVRPLLDTPRATIEAWARANGWTWREDASNEWAGYRRNALRHEVLPAVRAHFGEHVATRVVETAGRLQNYRDAMMLGGALLELVRVPGAAALRVDALRLLPVVLRGALYHEALEAWVPAVSRAALPAIDGLLDAQVGRRVEWPGAVVWRDRDALAFRPAEPGAPSGWEVVIDRMPVVHQWPGGTFSVRPLDAVPDAFDADPNVAVVDADAVGLPLVLRPWRDGDVIEPLGMAGTKRVSDLLTERRVPPQDRARQLVLTDAGRVVWVVGHRLAHAARLTPETRRAVRLRWAAAP